jgi:hypothetical protein
MTVHIIKQVGPAGLPKYIQLFGREYVVRELDPDDMRQQLIGLAIHSLAEIRVAAEIDFAAALKTFLHEAFHIGLHELGLEQSEQQAQVGSLLMHELLVRNPDILHCYLALAKQLGVKAE